MGAIIHGTSELCPSMDGNLYTYHVTAGVSTPFDPSGCAGILGPTVALRCRAGKIGQSCAILGAVLALMVFVLVVTNMKLTKEVRLAVTHPGRAASYLQRAVDLVVFAEVGVVVQIGYFFNLVYLFIILWLVMA